MKTKQDLVDRLIEMFIGDAVSRPFQIGEGGDVTVLDELLMNHVATANLIPCLPEEEWVGYNHLKFDIKPMDSQTLVIDKIKDIVNEWGDFRMGEGALENESAITIKEIGNTVSSAYAFGFDGVDCDIYVNDIETDTESFDYWDLELDVLEQILTLAELHKVDSEKTFKHSQD